MTEEYTIGSSPTPGGGSGGCNAGVGALLLLAAVPFVVKQKKRNK